jgi:hypothetical protein
MPTKKQIKEQIDLFIGQAVLKKSQQRADKKTEALIYALGFLEGVLIDAIYESPSYIQHDLLDRLQSQNIRIRR